MNIFKILSELKIIGEKLKVYINYRPKIKGKLLPFLELKIKYLVFFFFQQPMLIKRLIIYGLIYGPI